MCRSEAAELHAQKASIEAKGARLVCLLKGNGLVGDDEISLFRSDEYDEYRYWGKDTDLFLDDDLAFFKALGGGVVRKKSFLLALLNPFSTMYKAYRNIDAKTKADATLTGEGLIMGGLFVVNKHRVVFQHKEKDFGTVAPIEMVLDAVDEAVKK